VRAARSTSRPDSEHFVFLATVRANKSGIVVDDIEATRLDGFLQKSDLAWDGPRTSSILRLAQPALPPQIEVEIL